MFYGNGAKNNIKLVKKDKGMSYKIMPLSEILFCYFVTGFPSLSNNIGSPKPSSFSFSN